jgi:prepilin peptidase CpaA
MPVQPYLQATLVLLVAVAAINDLTTRRIPNRLLLAGLAAALALHALSAAPGAALGASLLGLAAGFAMFLPLYLLGGTAAGDVKLMATVGAFVGPAAALNIAVLSWCAGGAMALLILARRGRLRRAWANAVALLRPWLQRAAGLPAPAAVLSEGSVGTMPYGVAIALGTVAALSGLA